MEDNKDYFLCGICKAGFRSSSFLQFMEHMIRHFSVGRTNKCIICQKAFARIPALKDHLLHFHAIPLKIGPDPCSYSGNEKALLPGSARCNLFNKKAIIGDQGYGVSPTPNHCNYRSICLVDRPISAPQSKFVALERDYAQKASIDNLNACIEQSNAYLGNSNTWIESSNVFMENSNSSVDVLTISEVDQNITKEVSTENRLLPLSSQQNKSNDVSNCEVDLLSSNRPAGKDLGTDLFLLHTEGDEINFEENFDKIDSGKDNSHQKATKLNQICMELCGDDSTKITMESCAVNISKINSDKVHNTNTELLENNTQAKTRLHDPFPLDLSSSYNSSSTNANLQPQSERTLALSKTVLHDINNELDKVHKEMETELMTESSTLSVYPTESTVTTKLPRTHSDGSNKDRAPMVSEDGVDFHFFLGTTVISGSSITYNRIEFRCLHCPFTCAWRPSLVNHMKNSHSEALDFHEILDIRSIQSKSCKDDKLKKYKVMKLSEHISTTRKVRKRKKLARGIEQQDIPGKYNCPICNKVFRRLRYLRRHQMSHRTEKNHLCDTCGKSFKTKASLVAHYRSHRSRCYHCPQCNFVSNLTGAIHRHRQVHPNGSVVCDVCGAAYIDKSTLKKHGRVHDINRPFPCTFPGCTWRFKTENMKKAHLKAHTTEGKFRCLQCGYRFRHKHHLQRHLSRIHSNINHSTKYHSDLVFSSSLDPELSIVGSSSFLQHGLNTEEDLLKNTSNISLCSTRSLGNSQEILLSSIPENIPSSHNIPSHSNLEIKLPQTSVDIYVEEKTHDSSLILGLENNSDVVPSNMSSLQYVTEKEIKLPQTSVDVYIEEKTHDESLILGLENNSEVVPSNMGNLGYVAEKGNNSEVVPSNMGNMGYVAEKGKVVHVVKSGQVFVKHDSCGNLVEYRIADVQPGDEIQAQQFYFIGADGTVLGSTSSIDGTVLGSTSSIDGTVLGSTSSTQEQNVLLP